jgi:trans-aconitate 3-methyltransferase
MSTTDDQHSDLEVVSKEMSNSLSESMASVDSKFATPQESPKKQTNGHGNVIKLDTSAVNGNGDRNGSIDAVLNGSTATSDSISPDNMDSDPMLASALMSPLHDPLSLDAMLSPTGLRRTPSVLGKAHTLANQWELYKRAGPVYPPSLDALVMKYHQKHGKSWQLAHDLGAGSGVYARNLAKFFRHVHVSDPDSEGVATSKRLLGEWSKANPKKRGRFTFSATAPEEAQECCADGSVDFAVLAECAHFTNAEEVVRNVGKTLIPGGTLAIVTHRPVGTVVGNEKVNEAMQRLFKAWGTKPWDIASGSDSRSKQQFSLGLDFVPLPEDMYARDKTRRVTINTYGRAHDLFRHPNLDDEAGMSTDDMMDMPTNRVDEKERRHEYTENDEYGKGWRYEVGWESFRTRISLLDSPDTVRRLEPYLKEVQELIEKTSPNGVKVVLEWAVAVVLATRK